MFVRANEFERLFHWEIHVGENRGEFHSDLWQTPMFILHRRRTSSFYYLFWSNRFRSFVQYDWENSSSISQWFGILFPALIDMVWLNNSRAKDMDHRRWSRRISSRLSSMKWSNLCKPKPSDSTKRNSLVHCWDWIDMRNWNLPILKKRIPSQSLRTKEWIDDLPV